jgi:predicted neuraminidase
MMRLARAATGSLGLRCLAALLAVLLLLGLDAAARNEPSSPARAVVQALAQLPASGWWVRKASGMLPMPANTPSAHASFLLALPTTSPTPLRAFWFAGTRESAPDVQIVTSYVDSISGQWSPPQVVVNRAMLGTQLGFAVRRLGNPVAWLDAHGKVHLFVVATGLGGWAAGRVVHLRQTDDDTNPRALVFGNAGLLPLSWLWNISFLVRAAPITLTDGGMVLPAYFELGLKYPVALRFDAAGNFAGMTRISSRKHILQPVLLPLDATHWLALMRDQRPNGRITAAQTDDAGATWRDVPDLHLPNPDASIAALRLDAGHLLMAFNPSTVDRRALDLVASADGVAWTPQLNLAQGGAGDEYSYPALAWADGSLWASYTDHRKSIAWQRFEFQPVR